MEGTTTSPPRESYSEELLDKPTVRSATTTATTTTTKPLETQRRELAQALAHARLSREEELVLRMRHGLTEPRPAR